MHAIIKTVIHYVMSATRTLVLHVWLPAVIDEMIFTPIMDFLHFVNEEPPDDNTTSMEAENEGGGGAV